MYIFQSNQSILYFGKGATSAPRAKYYNSKTYGWTEDGRVVIRGRFEPKKIKKRKRGRCHRSAIY